VELSPQQIEHDFLLPLDNAYADIPETFYEHKKKLQHTLFELEDLTGAIGKISRSTDPEAAYQIFESDLEPYLGRGGLGPELSVRCDAFDDEDFLAVVKNHKQRLAKLKELGVADSYFDLFAAIEKTVITEVTALKAIAKSDVVKVVVEYRSKDLKRASVTVGQSSRDIKKFPLVKESELGRHIIYFKPWDWLSWGVRAGEVPPPKDPEEIRKMISNGSYAFRRVFQKEIDLYLLGKDLVSPWG
jgi:hypothetical protein